MRYFQAAMVCGLAGCAVLGLGPVSARAADTAVTCNAPVAYVITGVEQALPNYTIHCTGGSSAGGITYFSYKVAANATVAQLLAHVAGYHAIITGDAAITIYSNLSDLSGSAWGCGTANCRIIDQLEGY